MKTKLHNVITKCTTLSQLNSAANYLYLYGLNVGANQLYMEAVELWENKVRELTGAVLRNTIDYKEYAMHLLVNGAIDDCNEFIQLAENELLKLEIKQNMNGYHTEKRIGELEDNKITLFDHYAGLAMSSLIGRIPINSKIDDALLQTIILSSHNIANEMLKARKEIEP